MKYIVWQLPDGTLGMTTPSGQPMEGQTEDHYLDDVAMGLISHWQEQGKLPWRRMPNARIDEFPTVGFFEAWRHDGTKISVDLQAAKMVKLRDMLSRRDDLVNGYAPQGIVSMAVQIAQARLRGDMQAVASLQGKLQRLQGLDQTLPAQLAAINDLASLKAFSHPDLQ